MTGNEQTLYRFEYAFDGERQDVGLFQGLCEIGLNAKTVEGIERSFATLRPPETIDRECQFWFTEMGLLASAMPLKHVMRVAAPRYWSLVMATRPMPDPGGPETVYADPFQVALSPDGTQAYAPVNAKALDAIVKDIIMKERRCAARCS